MQRQLARATVACFIALLSLSAGLAQAQSKSKLSAVEPVEPGSLSGSMGSSLGSAPSLIVGRNVVLTLQSPLLSSSGAPQPVELRPTAIITKSGSAAFTPVQPLITATEHKKTTSGGQTPAATAGGQDDSSNPENLPKNLGRRFAEAAALWTPPQDSSLVTPAPAFDSPDIVRVDRHIQQQLSGMSALISGESQLFDTILKNSQGFLKLVDGHIQKGALDTRTEIRASESDSIKQVSDRTLRLGIYPVAADPFHWVHLLGAWQAMARLKLDKVIFIVQGDDERKPNLTKAELRHPVALATLAAYHPFFAYSGIALGTDFHGETNIFRILALNPLQKIIAYYMVGDDHYKKNDTLAKLEANRTKPELGFNPEMHEVRAAFLERLGHMEEVPTILDVQFLPKADFEASSTMIRNGHYELMPFDAYQYVRRNKLGLYRIPSD